MAKRDTTLDGSLIKSITHSSLPPSLPFSPSGIPSLAPDGERRLPRSAFAKRRLYSLWEGSACLSSYTHSSVSPSLPPSLPPSLFHAGVPALPLDGEWGWPRRTFAERRLHSLWDGSPCLFGHAARLGGIDGRSDHFVENCQV